MRVNLRLWLWRSLALSAAAGAVFSFSPSPPLAPLIPHHGWSIRGEFFENNRPTARDLETEALANPHARFFRSWHGPTVVGAEARTAPFVAPRVLIVPFVGYPSEPGISLDLECTTDGHKMAIATGNAHEIWSRALMVVPSGWCSDPVQIVAVDDSEDKYIGVGTPFEGSWWDVARSSALGIVFVQTVGFGLAVLPLLALAIVLSRRVRDGAWLVATAAYGAVAYSAFFLYQLDRYVAAATFLAGSIVSGLICFCWLQQQRGSDAERAARAMSNLRIAYAFSLVAALLLDLVDLRVGIWSSAYRFSPAAWSSDHLLPMIVADGIFNGTPARQIVGGLWHVSDRPPLLSGIILVAKPIIEGLSSGASTIGLAPLLTRAVAIATVGFGAVVLKEIVEFYSAGPTSRYFVATAIVAGLLSPFVLFNTVYTWPKLQGAFLALASVLVLTRMKGPEKSRSVLAGVLLGEALLMHAGVAFGLLALPVALRSQGWRWRTVPLCIAGAVTVLVWVPWSLWQRFVDPPGNGLIKVLLTGDRIDEKESVWTAFQATISQVTFEQWLWSRVDALRGTWGGGVRNLDFGDHVHGYLDRMRLADFLEPVTMWRFLGIAAVAALIVAARRRKLTEQTASALRWLLCGVIGVSVGLIVSWKYNVTHHHSYFSLCCVLVATLLLLMSLPRRFAWLLLALQAAYVLVVWVVHPMLVNGEPRASAAVLLVAAVAVLWLEVAASVDDQLAPLLPSATSP